MINGTTIFDIPIYSMTENQFTQKWEQNLKAEIDKLVLHGHERSKAEQTLREILGTKLFYKYNQIVGYIAVVKEQNDISFELYLSENKHYRYNTTRQNNIRYSIQVGRHFYIRDNWGNKEIADEIYSWLTREAEYQKERGRYLDLTLFLTTYKHIDYMAIFAESNK